MTTTPKTVTELSPKLWVNTNYGPMVAVVAYTYEEAMAKVLGEVVDEDGNEEPEGFVKWAQESGELNLVEVPGHVYVQMPEDEDAYEMLSPYVEEHGEPPEEVDEVPPSLSFRPIRDVIRMTRLGDRGRWDETD